MTLREAIRRLRVRMAPPAKHCGPGLCGPWWGDLFATEAIEVVVRALSRPTRLEREAARLLRDLPWLDASGTAWLKEYERKRKGARRG